MNSIEKELSNGKPFTFVKKKGLGKCPVCNVIVYEDELFVEEDGNVYHYACYNQLKSEE